MISWLIIAFIILCIVYVHDVSEGFSLKDLNATPANTEEQEAEIAETAERTKIRAAGAIDCAVYETKMQEFLEKRKDLTLDLRYCRSTDNQSCAQIPNPYNPTLPCPPDYSEKKWSDFIPPLP